MKQKIAVIGAGPMGLAAAYQFALAGYDPVLFEADDRVGGMTAVFDFDGLAIERYYHFHCTSDIDFFTIISELGLSHTLKWSETKMGYWYKDKLQSWGNPLSLLAFSGLSLISKFRYGLFAFISTKRNNWKKLDNVEASGWIKKWVGLEAWEILWKKLFSFKFYEYSTNLSAAWIWSRIRRIGRSRYSLMKEKLGYLEGGSDTFLRALVSSIEANGGRVLLNSRIEKVVIEKNIVKGVLTKNGFEPFDIVFSTIPLPYVPKLIPDLPLDIIESFRRKNNISVICVIVKLRKSLTKNFWLNIVDDSMDIPGIVEYTNLNSLSDKIVYVPYYVPIGHPVYEQTDAEFIDRVKNYFCKINPDLNDSDFLSIKINRYQYAQPICEPGYLKNLPPVQLPVNGLWVADTSYYYPEDRGISESIGYGRTLARVIIENNKI